MATVNKNCQINTKASNGDIVKIYPNTKIANVEDLQTSLDAKVDKISGKGLSTNDYTTTEKNKLAGIADGATANIGTVTEVKVGSASYSPSSGIVSLPAYPTTLPASDVSSWAKASSKPSYTQDEVGDGTTYKRVSATEKTTWNNKGTYSKPSGGIPKTDLTSAVQTSLGKADTALQSFTETDPTVPSWAKQSSKPSYTYSEVGAAPASHGHYQITTVGDYRSIATKPDDYPNIMQFKGLKNNSAIGNPSSDTYSYVLGLRGWPDHGGGNAHEFAFNDTGIFTRRGASTSWGSWAKLAMTSDIPSSLPASDVYAWAKASTKPSYTYSEVGAAPASHTHNYAGSSSAGGVATSAAKLSNTSKIGDTNKPVYFKADGTPAAISYTIDKSVPSNAVFTDTTYSAATQSAAGLMSAADKTKLDGIATGANNYSLPNATTSSKGGVIVGSNLSVSNGTISMSSANVVHALGYTPANNDGVNQALNTRVVSATYGYVQSSTSTIRIYKSADRGVILAVYGSQGGTNKQSSILVFDVQQGILSVRRLAMGGNSEVVDGVTINEYSQYHEAVVTLTVPNSQWPPVIIPLMRADCIPQIEVL